MEVIRRDECGSLKPFIRLKELVEQKKYDKDFPWKRLGQMWHDDDVSLSITAYLPSLEQVTVANRASVEKSDRELTKEVDMKFGFYLHTFPADVDDDDSPLVSRKKTFTSSLVLSYENRNMMSTLLRTLYSYSFLVSFSPFPWSLVKISWRFLEAPSVNTQQTWICPSSLRVLQTARLQTQQDASFFLIVRNIESDNNNGCTIIATCTRNDLSITKFPVDIICYDDGFPISQHPVRQDLIDWKQFGLSVRAEFEQSRIIVYDSL